MVRFHGMLWPVVEVVELDLVVDVLVLGLVAAGASTRDEPDVVARPRCWRRCRWPPAGHRSPGLQPQLAMVALIPAGAAPAWYRVGRVRGVRAASSSSAATTSRATVGVVVGWCPVVVVVVDVLVDDRRGLRRAAVRRRRSCSSRALRRRPMRHSEHEPDADGDRDDGRRRRSDAATRLLHHCVQHRRRSWPPRPRRPGRGRCARSGSVGASYGSSIPVKFGSSPARALA